MLPYTPADVNTRRLAILLSLPRPVLIAILFVVVFLAARLAIVPTNTFDYDVHQRALAHFWRGASPYAEPDYLYPSWAIFVTAPLYGRPVATALALTVALFVVSVVDTGKPHGVLLLVHPVFVVLLASANPEWLFVGSGLWLLTRSPRGYGRGMAWLLLACKPQTTFLLLAFDGIAALQERDWRAFMVAGAITAVTFALYPMPLGRYWLYDDSMSILWRWGVGGAVVATAIILAVRWRRRDRVTLGVLLSAVWTPYLIQYHLVSGLWLMRSSPLWSVALYSAVGFGAMLLFWREYHVAEYIGCAVILATTAVLAPVYPDKKGDHGIS